MLILVEPSAEKSSINSTWRALDLVQPIGDISPGRVVFVPSHGHSVLIFSSAEMVAMTDVLKTF
jgi:transcription termination factor Rho